MDLSYYKTRDQKYVDQKEHYLNMLPFFVTQYTDAMEGNKAPSTLATYTRQLYTFFNWVYNADIIEKPIMEWVLEDLTALKTSDITMFVRQLRKENASDATVLSYIRTVSALYSFFMHDTEYDITVNPAAGVIRPKPKDKQHIFLDEIDMDRFEKTLINGDGLSKRMAKYRDTINTVSRDIAIMSVLVDTGIRVSELVGMNLSDIDLERFRFPVQRKGQNIQNVYFSDQTSVYIKEYIDERKKVADKNENAFFVSFVGAHKGKRLSVRSVEKIVKKYALAAGVSNAEQIHAHSLRHTCAMALLSATGNLALTQKKLGHSSVQSTAIYAKADERELEKNRNTNALH